MNNQEIYITKRIHKVSTLESVRLDNNQILVKEVFDNMNTPTKRGIYKASEQFKKNQFLANYANRVHTVVKTCGELTFWTNNNKLSGNCLRWKCDMDVEVGDTVWISYPAAIEYDALVCDGVEYKLVNYSEIRLAKKPDGRTVLCNGWSLYKHPQEPRSTILIDPKPKIDYSRGIIVEVGKPNKEYIVNEKKWIDIDSKIPLKEGDVFIKDSPANKLILEDALFRYYSDEDIYLILRKNILAIMS